MLFPKYVEKCLGDFPLEKLVIYIEKYLIDSHIKYNILRSNDIIIKIKDDNIVDIFKKIISENPELFSSENVITDYLTIHELETNTIISFAYYENLL